MFQATALMMMALCVLSGKTLCATSNKGCQPPWLAYKNHCYLTIDEHLPFKEVEEHCQELSKSGRPAHLVSVADDSFIRGHVSYAKSVWIKDSYWIGGLVNIEDIIMGCPLNEEKVTWVDEIPAADLYIW